MGTVRRPLTLTLRTATLAGFYSTFTAIVPQGCLRAIAATASRVN
jgi:hypothetical protein